MQHRTESPLPAKLADGRRHFERWRREHKPYTRLPEPLWSMAADLARDFGVNRVASLLRLNYYDLKKRLEPPASPTSKPPPFLELLGDKEPPNAECTIECTDEAGTQIRIQFKGCEMPDLTELCAELWSTDR